MKKPWITADVLEAIQGDLLSGTATRAFSAISIDSRNISADDLFFAIKGQTHDGHDFVTAVIDFGVKGVIINRNRSGLFPISQWKEAGVVSIAVTDTTRALGDLAAFHRKLSKASVVAITGSNGKTTTKDMAAAVVSRRFRVLSTSGNFNNQIGVPLTLFNLKPEHQWAVLELGTNHPGEIRRLAEISLPDIGVITNIGPAHLEGLGSLDGVMHAKAELLEKIKPAGVVVLNADDERIMKIAKNAPGETVFFGRSERATIRADSIAEKESGISLNLLLPTETVSVNLFIHGGFMISNALAAAAIGHLIGLSAQDIRAGLEAFRPAPGRMNVLRTPKGINIINDSYNANPGSMEAALITLKVLSGDQRGFFVAGDMLELGSKADSLHREIGSRAARSDIARLYVTGKHANAVASGAMNEHMNSRDIFMGTKEEICRDLAEHLRKGDWVLVKGSRAMGMEKIIDSLLNSADG
jgi:UDP-N-acetylmuramoyl-tripeptide--D-alanyl-D-alanine ligase